MASKVQNCPKHLRYKSIGVYVSDIIGHHFSMQLQGKTLVGEIFGTQLTCCRLKGQDSVTKFMIVLNNAMDGQDSDKFPFSFFDRHGKYVEALLTANKRTDAEGSITGVFCFLHIASAELLQVRFGNPTSKNSLSKNANSTCRNL